MKVVVTICSKRKNETEGLLPAGERYMGEHIKKTEKLAKQLQLPFFILSGKYGLVPVDKAIPNYDYYLEMSAIEDLAKIVETQLREFNITEAQFYTEGKKSWIPYEAVLMKATESGNVVFSRRHI